MSIRTIVKSYYTTHEVEILSQNILNKLTNLKPENPYITSLASKLSESLDLIKEASNNSKHNTKTEQLLEADQKRDLAFRAFFAYVEAGVLRQNKTYSALCADVMEYLDRFDKQLYRYSYSKESVELRKLFDELEHVADQIKKIQANGWLSELKEAENEFLKVQEAKINEESENKIFVTSREAKESGLNQLIKVTQMLNGLEDFGIEGLSTLVKDVDTIVAEVEVPAKARMGRKTNQPDEE